MEKRSSGEDAERHASKRLAAVLRAEIMRGDLAPGVRLPSYRQLAKRYGVVVNTAQAAVRTLQVEGLVVIRPGSGAYVQTEVDMPPNDLRQELEDVRDRLRLVKEMLSATERTVNKLLDHLGPLGLLPENEELRQAIEKRDVARIEEIFKRNAEAAATFGVKREQSQVTDEMGLASEAQEHRLRALLELINRMPDGALDFLPIDTHRLINRTMESVIRVEPDR